jgi:hypothetical protein
MLRCAEQVKENHGPQAPKDKSKTSFVAQIATIKKEDTVTSVGYIQTSNKKRHLNFFILLFLYLLTCVYIIWATSPHHHLWAEPVPHSCTPILLKKKHKR